eukprot:jgi/Picre1/34788/NNA_002254.t1
MNTRKQRNGTIVRSGEDDEEDFGALNIDDIIQQHVDEEDEYNEAEEEEEEGERRRAWIPRASIEGWRGGGHDWANEAGELGAVAVLAARPLPDCVLPVVVVDDLMLALAQVAAEFYEYPATAMNTVAFVGSYGKTTASWLTREDRLTREGDVWVADEEDPTVNRDCSKVLAGGADRGAESAVVEVCPASLDDKRAAAFKPGIVVFTNVSEEKAYYDGKIFDEYLESVGEMFASLDASQIAILNIDDPYADSLRRTFEDTGAQMLTYGVTSKNADVYAEKVKSSIWETEILVKTPVGRLEIIVPLVGEFNVSNVLAAVSVGLARGIKLVNIVAGIEAVDIIPGRCELVEEGQPFPVIVDASKTPQQLSRLIDDVKEAGARKTILVMGCPGSTPVEHRSAMGNMSHFKADIVFLTNDSPGVCPPDRIINDIVSGMPEEVTGRHAGSYHNWLQDPHRDRFSAIRVAIGLAKPKDVVIIAGRGHVDNMEYWDGISPLPDYPNTRESPEGIEGNFFEDPGLSASDSEDGATTTVLGWFDDRVEARNAVAKLRYLNGIKDLDRSTIPWTRYPEEREQSGLSATVGSEAAAASGQYLGDYLRNVVDENREAARLEDDSDEDDALNDEFESLDMIAENEQEGGPAPNQQHDEQRNASLEEEREKHRRRAEKFGVEYVDPATSKRREFKHQLMAERRSGSGFTTGFDLFTEEEAEKRQQRAARFNMPGVGLEWNAADVVQDAEKRRQRAERFGTTVEPQDHGGLMDVDLYEDRKEAPAEVERRPEAVHIYGVDLLSTKDLLSFCGLWPKYIEWINDSSANVVFNDSATAKRAIAGMGVPMVSEDVPEGASVSDPRAMEYLWHKGHDFKKAGSDIPLVFRVATVLDVKPAERVKSRRLWVSVGRQNGSGAAHGKKKKVKGRGAMKFSRGGVQKKGRKQRQTRVPHDDEREPNVVDMVDAGNARGRGLVKYDDF